MKRSAKETKKENNQTKENDGVSTIEEALDRIERDPRASATLRELAKSGFDEAFIEALVFSFCGGTVKMARAGLKKAKSFTTQLENCAKQLETAAESVRTIIDVCEKHRYGLTAEGLPEKMQELAERMWKVAAANQKGLQTIRIGGANQAVRRNGVAPTSGRDFILVYLSYLIAGGNKPSIDVYRQVAHLVAAVTGELDPDYEKMAGRFRKDVERFLNRAVRGSIIIDRAKCDAELLRSVPDSFRT